MKKEERDQIIDLKLSDLEEKRLKLQTELAETSKYSTNMKIQLPGTTELIILRTVKEKRKLILLLGDLLFMKDKWERGHKECFPKATEVEDFDICGFSIMDWISDLKNLIQKLQVEEEIKKLDKAIQDLPKFYTEDKKDEIEFKKLLDSLE